MLLSYSKLSKRPHVFQQMTGVSVSEFQTIATQVQPRGESSLESLKRNQQADSVSTGRPSINPEFVGSFVWSSPLSYLSFV